MRAWSRVVQVHFPSSLLPLPVFFGGKQQGFFFVREASEAEANPKTATSNRLEVF